MTTITKSIEIPEDRRLSLNLDLPENLPAGPAELCLIINPAAHEAASPPRKPFAGLFGILKNKAAYDGDGVDLQRQWRDEWPT